MYCNNCGEKLDTDSKYCTNCGTKVEISNKRTIKDKNINQKKNIIYVIVGIVIVIFIFSTSIYFGKKITTYFNGYNTSNKNSAITDNYYNDSNGNSGSGNNGYNNGDNGFGNFFDDQEDNNSNDSTTNYNFKNITVDDFLSLKSGSDLSIVYIGRASCSYCIQESMILYTVANNYNLSINYLDISNITSEDYQKLASSDTFFNGNWGIPVILLVKNGEIVDKANGLQSANQLYNFFNTNGQIN